VSEENTQNLTSGRSFEERVFARFDSVDSRFDSVDSRFDSVDSRFDSVDSAIRDLDGRVQTLEVRSYDTKPLWEQALKEILETRRELAETRTEIVDIRRDFSEARRNLLKRFDRMLAITTDTREDMQEVHDRLEKVESQLQK
jgi:chromosome segregation ATPase